MIKNIFLYVGVILVLFFLVSGCVSGQPTEEPATDDPVQTEQATLSPTDVPTETFEPEEANEEAEEPEETGETEDGSTDDAASSDQASACVECHTDQAKLMDTADPVEEVESENEGAG